MWWTVQWRLTHPWPQWAITGGLHVQRQDTCAFRCGTQHHLQGSTAQWTSTEPDPDLSAHWGNTGDRTINTITTKQRAKCRMWSIPWDTPLIKQINKTTKTRGRRVFQKETKETQKLHTTCNPCFVPFNNVTVWNGIFEILEATEYELGIIINFDRHDTGMMVNKQKQPSSVRQK